MKRSPQIITTFFAFILGLALAHSTIAQIPGQVPVGARPIMMGEAFVAVADDGNTPYWNPAGLARLQRTQFSFGFANLFGLGINNYYGSFLTRFFLIPALTDYFAFGGNLSLIGVADGQDEDDFKFSNDRYHVSLAFQPPSNWSYLSPLSLGANFKYFKMSAELEGTPNGAISGLGWDLGLLYDLSDLPRVPEGLRFGLMMYDAGGTGGKHRTGKREILFPQKTTWGLSYRPFEEWPWGGKIPLTDPVLALDIDDRVHVGLEFWLARFLALRAGWQKDRHTKENAILSFGIGLRTDRSNRSTTGGDNGLKRILFDVPLLDSREVSNTRQFNLSIITKEDPRLIRIEGAHINDVFASLYRHYEQRGAGMIKLRNVSLDTMKTWVAFEKNRYLQLQKADTVFVPPQSTVDFPLRLVFEPDSIFNMPERRLAARVKVGYERHQKKTRLTETNQYFANASIDFAVYGKNYLTWDDPGKAAAFVTYDDPVVESFKNAVLTQKKKLDGAAWLYRYGQFPTAVAVYNALQVYGLDYQLDKVTPFPVLADTSRGARYRRDTVKYPAQFLNPADRVRIGDCDDFAVLYASLLQAAGMATAFISGPGHIFMMFDTEVPAANLRAAPVNPDRFVVYQGTLWIPIETTLIPKSHFDRAWETAANVLASARSNGDSTKWKPYAVAEYQAKYPAAPPQILKFSPTLRDPIPDFSATMQNGLAALDNMRQEYFSIFERDSLKAGLSINEELRRRNHYGVLLGQNDQYGRAQEQFEKIVKLEPGHAAAWNNWGNVDFILGNFPRAEASYQKALLGAVYSHGIYLNLAILYQMMSRNVPAKDSLRYQEQSMKMIEEAARLFGGNVNAVFDALGYSATLVADGKAAGESAKGPPKDLLKRARNFVDKCFKQYLGKKQIRSEVMTPHGTKGKDVVDEERSELVWWSY